MPDFSADHTPDELSVVTPTPAASGLPQFATAEYSHIPGTERCRICGNLVTGDYYRIQDHMACADCATRIKAGQPVDSHSAFSRGLLLGIGAAIVALAVYATFTIVTHIYLGYLALGVGWFIAKAIMKGSGNLSGRRYQIAAVLLTYFAISLSAIPIDIAAMARHRQQPPKVQNPAVQTQPSTSSENPFPGDQSAQAAQPSQSAQPTKPASTSPKYGLLQALSGLLLIGVASPFLALSSPFQGAIGLFILFIGLRIAWQMTAARRLEVDGPYSPARG